MDATDAKLVDAIHRAAEELAKHMNAAADVGLIIELEMKPHSSWADTRRVYKRGDYRPVISISRTITFNAEATP